MFLKLSLLYKGLLPMDMPINQTNQSISISLSILRNFNMENSKESKTLKLNNKKPIKKDKRSIKKILSYGKLQSPTSRPGNHLGDRVDQVGISNVLLWHLPF